MKAALISTLSPDHSQLRRPLHRAWRFVVGPLLFYGLWYIILTFPLVLQFNRIFFMPAGDGEQMIWDLWWVRYSILHLHQSPFFTQYLEYPQGTTLLLHTLMPAVGLMSIPLSAALSQIQTFNLLIILAFSSSALTAFWLCWKVTRNFWPSMAGGFAYAFCSYRWAHSFGHLNLISTEALPLYLIALLSMLRQPRIVTAAAMAIFLLFALLCDQYQVLYCAVLTLIVGVWWWYRFRHELTGKHIVAGAAFVVFAGILCGPMVLAMQRLSHDIPGWDLHNPEYYSGDLLGPWFPDWAWVYGKYTRPLWNSPTASYEEKSICLGPAVLIAAAFAFSRRRGREALALGSVGLFAAIAIVFVLLCFGPTWRFWTIPISTFTPYRALGKLIPSLRVGGCPGRMIVMAQLAVSVLAAVGLCELAQIRSVPRRMLLQVIFSLGMILESQPRVMTVYPGEVPHWVQVVRDDPAPGAVIDLIWQGSSPDLFYQTVHHRPIALGDVSRILAATAHASDIVMDNVAAHRYGALAQMGFGFIVDYQSAPPLPLPLAFEDRAVRIYRLPLNSMAERG